MMTQERLQLQLRTTECICMVLESPGDLQIAVETTIPILCEPTAHIEYLIRKGMDEEVYDKWFMSCNDGDSYEFEQWQDIVDFIMRLADACRVPLRVNVDGQ